MFNFHPRGSTLPRGVVLLLVTVNSLSHRFRWKYTWTHWHRDECRREWDARWDGRAARALCLSPPTSAHSFSTLSPHLQRPQKQQEQHKIRHGSEIRAPATISKIKLCDQLQSLSVHKGMETVTFLGLQWIWLNLAICKHLKTKQNSTSALWKKWQGCVKVATQRDTQVSARSRPKTLADGKETNTLYK